MMLTQLWLLPEVVMWFSKQQILSSPFCISFPIMGEFACCYFYIDLYYMSRPQEFYCRMFSYSCIGWECRSSHEIWFILIELSQPSCLLDGWTHWCCFSHTICSFPTTVCSIISFFYSEFPPLSYCAYVKY